MTPEGNLICFRHFSVYLTILVISASAKNQENLASELVDILNENRTGHKLPKLRDNPGLGCMALQYIEKCEGNCSSTNTLSCHPPEEDITEVFAPNCGVELPTVDIISGQIIGCQSKYLPPIHTFSDVLVRDNKTLTVVRDKQHTEVGIGFKRTRRGTFFWCILFSSGQSNSTFILEGGTGIKQKKGCYSGTNTQCSGGQKTRYLHEVSVLCFALLICVINDAISSS